MLIYDETIRVLNEDWAYIAKVYDEEPLSSSIFGDIRQFMWNHSEYLTGEKNCILGEMSIIKRPAWEYNGVLQKPSLVMKFKRYEGDGL
jgi:hypothetical protein